VVFHVGYWDYIGWKDRLADPAYTQRQRDYVNFWNGTSLYTPCFSLDGKAWLDWRRSQTVARSDEEVGILRAEEVEGNHFAVSFKPVSGTSDSWQAHIALLGFGVRSDVSAGENFGKTLNHNFVVLDYTQNNLANDEGELTAEMGVNVPSDIESEQYGIAVWVTHQSSPQPIQSTGGYTT